MNKFPVFKTCTNILSGLTDIPKICESLSSKYTHSFCIYIFKATLIPLSFSAIVADVFLNAFTLCHQGSLQNNPPLLVSLVVLCGKLVHPAKFCVTVLAGDVANHVSPRQHDTVLYLTVVQVDHFVEEEGSACGTYYTEIYNDTRLYTDVHSNHKCNTVTIAVMSIFYLRYRNIAVHSYNLMYQSEYKIVTVNQLLSACMKIKEYAKFNLYAGFICCM